MSLWICRDNIKGSKNLLVYFYTIKPITRQSKFEKNTWYVPSTKNKCVHDIEIPIKLLKRYTSIQHLKPGECREIQNITITLR
jgi:hypothetical protein